MPKYRVRLCPEVGMSLDSLTQRFAFLGRTGSGKSHNAGVLAEEFLKNKQQIVIIDPQGCWYGLRSSADGKKPAYPILIMGGAKGDLPLEPTAGVVVADMVAEEGQSVILDFSLFENDADEIRFMTDFADRLFRKNKHPVHLFIDEADNFMPQSPMREEIKLLNRMQRLAKRGRFKGIGMSLISQRSAAISKRCLSQTEIMVAMQTTDPRDKRAIGEWVEDHATDEADEKTVMSALAGLSTGEAWVWSPTFLKILKRVTFRKKETFDSSATPKVGQRRRAPKSLASVDLEKLKKRMAATIEKQKQDDPRLLREKIAALLAELSKEKRKAQLQPIKETVQKVIERPGKTKVVIKYVPIIKKRDLRRLEKAVEKGTKIKESLGFIGQSFDTIAREMWNEVRSAAEKAEKMTVDEDRKKTLGRLAKVEEGSTILAGKMREESRKAPPIVINARPVHRQNRVEPARALPLTPENLEDGGEVVIKAGARKMIQTLATFKEDGLSRRQLATLVGMVPTGGTYGQYVSAIKRAGYAFETDGTMFISNEGLEYLDGDYEKTPMSLEEILKLWRGSIKAGAFKLVEYLVSIYPNEVTREELAAACNFDPAGGTYGQYVSMIVRNTLADKVESDKKTTYRASKSLFIGEGVKA